MKIETIIYDWNGTLLDDTDMIVASCNVGCERTGKPKISRQDYAETYDMPFERFLSAIGYTPEDAKKHIKAIHQAFFETYAPIESTTSLREGAVEFLQEAHQKGVKQFILSNHLTAAIQMQVNRLGIAPYIHGVMARENIEEHCKNLPKIEKLRVLFDKKQFNPATTVIIGDSLEEIRIGHELKMTSVALLGGGATAERFRALNPTFLFNDWHQMRELFAA